MSKDGWYRHAHKPSTKAHWTEFTESQAFEGYGYLRQDHALNLELLRDLRDGTDTTTDGRDVSTGERAPRAP